MKHTIIIFLLAFTSNLFSQSKTDSISSAILGESRKFIVSLPADYEKNKENKFPLLLLLDGQYLFNPFNGALTYANYWDDLPQVIIVAINQKDTRETDCEIGDNGLPGKKGIKFFDFVNNELLPTLEKQYRLSPLRIIAGHDFTAGFANLFLYQKNPAFNAYILFSPELHNTMFDRVPQILQDFKRPVFYYMATADGDLKQTKEDALQLHESLAAIENKNLFLKRDEFTNASHYSLVLQAIPNALYHIFSVYRPISNAEFLEKIVVLEKDHTLYLKQKYDIIKKDYGIDIKIRLSDFSAIEAAIIKNKDYNAFDDLAILARKNYPKSLLADYFLAMQFEYKGDDARALKYYLQAHQQEEVGDITKVMMMDRAEILKTKLSKNKKSK